MELINNNNVIEKIYNLLPYNKLIMLLRVNKNYQNDGELKEQMKEKRAEKIGTDIYEYFIIRVYNRNLLNRSFSNDIKYYVNNIAFAEMKLSRIKNNIDNKIKNKINEIINQLYSCLLQNKLDEIDTLLINRIIKQMTKYIT